MTTATTTASDRRAAIREAARRDLARVSLLDFITTTDPDYVVNWHHKLVCEIVQDWIEGKRPPRIVLEMPPAHGKSTIVSRCAPAWILGNNPRAKIIACSHTQNLANDMSRDVMDVMRTGPYIDIFGEVIPGRGGAAEAWRTIEGGSYRCAGVGGPIAGKHMNFGIIDDPVKNAEEAFSVTVREKVWQWYTRVFRPRRIGASARMLLTTTRWHEDDLAGRILDREAGKWTRLRLPAIGEHDSEYRKRGEPLWPERYPLDFLAEEKELAPHSFEALYQQRPVAEGGGMFKRDHFRYAEAGDSPDLVRVNGQWRNIQQAFRFATVDLAASTKATGDYTVIGTFASFPDGQLVLVDLVRKRLEGPDIIPEIAYALNRWRSGAAYVEKIGFQTALIQMAVREGLPVREVRPDKDKVTRAAPAAALMANGKLWFRDGGDWLVDLENELLSFPVGAHDDQADVLAYGVRVHNDRTGWQVKTNALY